VQAEWEPDELIGAWTLVKGDWDLIANKAGVTRLGFAVMLKFYEIEGRFPAYREEVPQAAVDYLGSLVKAAPALFAKYSWRGRTIEYHRAQIRRAYGTRPPTEADEDRWAQWLAGEMCPTETNRDPGRPGRGLPDPWPAVHRPRRGADERELRAHRRAAAGNAGKRPGSPRLPGYGEQPAPAGWREDQGSSRRWRRSRPHCRSSRCRGNDRFSTGLARGHRRWMVLRAGPGSMDGAVPRGRGPGRT
jgi:Domain of unknown function (DUF4158)